MKCYMETRQTDSCVACRKKLESSDEAKLVRIENNMGYSIHAMCTSCMDKYTEYKKKKESLMRV